MTKLQRLVHWLDDNVIVLLTAFLFAFIPLFPKLPLFDALPGYIVRVRAEDFFVFFTAIVWLLQVLRKKVPIQKSLLLLIGIYAVIGFLSIAMGVGLLKTIPAQLLHIGKSGLHYFRYLEYFSLLLFAHSAIQTKKQLKYFIIVLALTVLLATVYGFGQKYLHWPLYSTMNREYSKGEALYLSEFARIQSTFAGHYDLAAYLVLVLPILLATALTAQKRWLQILLHISHISGVWLLLAGASKSSLVGYGITVLIVLLVHFRRFLKNIKGVLIAGSIGLVLSILGFLALILISPDVYKSVAQLTKNVSPLYTVVLTIDSFVPADSPLKLQTQNLTESGKAKPDDVYVNIPDLVKVATVSATGGTTYIIVEKERTWSDNALKYGLSLAIRLDTLWPQALRGFVRNPLFGSAYATLNKEKTAQYTEADSTDNNFLRVLGETGLLGFVSFFGVLLFVTYQTKKAFATKDSLLSGLALGFLAGTVGLLINAITIDVFAASKVAFTYWALSGLVIGGLRTVQLESSKKIDSSLQRNLLAFGQKNWPVLIALLIFFFLTHQNPFTEHSPILNFSKNQSGAEYIASARCYLENGRFELCREEVHQSNSFKLYSLLLIPFLWIYDNPGMYYFLNVFVATVLIVATYAFITKISTSSKIIALSLLLLVSHSLLRNGVGTAGTPYIFPLLGFIFGLIAFTWSIEKVRTLTSLNIEKAAAYLSIVLCIVLFTSTANTSMIITNFADEHTNWGYPFLKRVNTFFYDYTVGNTLSAESKKPLFVSNINPYFSDLYSNNLFTLVPLLKLSAEQTNVWSSESYEVFTKINAGESLDRRTFISDFQLDDAGKEQFAKILTAYDVSVEDTGCANTCTIFELHSNVEKLSPQPITWQGNLDLNTLPESYQFSVISQRFGDLRAESNYGTSDVASILQTVTASQHFSVIMGDIMPNYDEGQKTLLSQLFLDTSTVPLIFVPGNEDQEIPRKAKVPLQTFFTKEDVFISLQPQTDGSFSHDQQIHILNTLYDLDKLPQLKNVFIFVNQAVWVGANKNPAFQEFTTNLISNSPQRGNSFFLSTVLPFLEARNNLSIFVISGDTMPTGSAPVFSQKVNNVQYYSTATNGTRFDHFLTFTKSKGQWSVDIAPLIVAR